MSTDDAASHPIFSGSPRTTRLCATIVVVLVVLSVLPASIAAQERYEFGDAPDGEPTGYPSPFAQTGDFPKFLASDGARTETAQVHLGAASDLELDGLAVNGDTDDGITDMTIATTGIPATASLSVEVNADGSVSAGTVYYLNVLIDMDMDGSWGGSAGGGESEWAVRNHEVTIDDTSGPTRVTTPAFAYGNGNRLPDGAWMRIAVTSTPVRSSDWDGSGAFADGEIEDHVIELPPGGKMLQTFTGKRVYYVRDNTPIPFDTAIRNTGGVPTTYAWQLAQTAGGLPVNYGGPSPPAPQVCSVQCSGTVTLRPGRDQTFDFVAVPPGTLPSRYQWTVTIEDPAAVVHPWGVEPGHTGEGTIDLEFRGAAADDPATVITDPTKADLISLVDRAASTPRVQDYVDPDDTLLITISSSFDPDATSMTYTHVSITNVGRADGDHEVTFYDEEGRPLPDADVTISTTSAGYRSVINSPDPFGVFVTGLTDDWIVVTFGNPMAQVSWNALILSGLAEYREGRFGGAGSTVRLRGGESGTAELIEEEPETLYIVRSEGPDPVLNTYGTQIGLLPAFFDTAGEDDALGYQSLILEEDPEIEYSRPSVPSGDPVEIDIGIGDSSREWIFDGGAPDDADETTPSMRTYINDAPQRSTRVRASYTVGMSYLQESGGGSYAVGMATNAYARNAATGTSAYGATAAAAVGGGYFGAGV